MKYLIYPDAGDGMNIPTTPEPLTAEQVGVNLATRLKAMEAQGYWRDCRMQKVELSEITYHVVPAEDEPEEGEMDSHGDLVMIGACENCGERKSLHELKDSVGTMMVCDSCDRQ